ncbi:glycosyltransferase [Priestia megaterium]|uniref:glycosyltransferase n=1 Tax=Priestia megaterium TaxID=1404 RepID=UPI0028780A73|nr:glycosyltransferase [Priestia megaterium]
MKILVNATANDSRGPLSLTYSFIEEMNKNPMYFKDKNLKLTILVSKKELCVYSNDYMKIIYCLTPKKSIFHKSWFEYFYLPKLIKKKQYDAYLSLQNLGLKNSKVKQFVLIHTPLPFADLKFNEIEWKNYIKYKILMKTVLNNQIKRFNGIIVQTNWMKESIMNGFNYKGKTKIIRPRVEDIKNKNEELDRSAVGLFDNSDIKLFCPTNEEYYKNSHRLIQAVSEYNKEAEKKVKLYITLEKKQFSKEENIVYLGRVEYNQIFNIYIKMDGLIFPSLTETLGLPLIEAEQAGIDRLVSDMPYAKEICKENAWYFNPRSEESIIETLRKYVSYKTQSENYNQFDNRVKNELINNNNTYIDYIDFITENLVKE